MKGGATIEQLYRSHSYAVFRRCRRLLHNEAEARDMTQEVFVRFMERQKAFEGRSSVGTYLFSIATHLCLNRIRDSRARGESWQESVCRHIVEHQRAGSIDSDLDARRVTAALLGETDEKTATIVLGHYVDGLSQGEIAALVGLSRVTVNQRLGSFRERARHLLGEDMS